MTVRDSVTKRNELRDAMEAVAIPLTVIIWELAKPSISRPGNLLVVGLTRKELELRSELMKLKAIYDATVVELEAKLKKSGRFTPLC